MTVLFRLLVGCFVSTIKQNYRTDVPEMWMEPRMDPTDFWCRSGKMDRSRDVCLRVFIDIFGNFSGHGWILMKRIRCVEVAGINQQVQMWTVGPWWAYALHSRFTQLFSFIQLLVKRWNDFKFDLMMAADEKTEDPQKFYDSSWGERECVTKCIWQTIRQSSRILYNSNNKMSTSVY